MSGHPRRIRVAHLLFQRTLSGAPRAALDIATRLDRKRFEAELVCAGAGEVAQHASASGLEVRFADNLVWGRIALWRDLRAIVGLSRLFRKARYDVVHTHSSKAGFVGRMAAKLAGVPAAVHTVQGFAFHEFSAGFKEDFFVGLERLAGRFTEALVFVNDEDLALARERRIGRPENHVRLTNGIDLEPWNELPAARRREVRAAWMPDATGKLVVFVGRLAPQKGPEDLMEAAAALARKRSDLVVLMVGEGELESSLRERVRERGLDSVVRFAGWRGDVPDILRSADLFCLPSYWEGLPLAILEAMAARLPVVVSDIKGNRELVKNGVTGLLFAPGDLNDLAASIERVLGEPELASRLSAAARRELEASYSMSAVVRCFEELYERLLSARV